MYRDYRDSGCSDCKAITSGDCGKHGPLIITPDPVGPVPEGRVFDAPTETDDRVTPWLGYCPHCPIHEGLRAFERLNEITRESRQCPRCKRLYFVRWPDAPRLDEAKSSIEELRSIRHAQITPAAADPAPAIQALMDAQQQLVYWWTETGRCPCGARRETPETHSHIIGCPTAAALRRTEP